LNQMHIVDYQIHGTDCQYVEIELDPGEVAIADPGSMLYMENGIQMETIFGGTSKRGGLMGALQAVLAGENMFTTAFQNCGQGKKKVAITAPYSGQVIAIDLGLVGGSILAQRHAFLAGAKGVNISVAFQRRLGAGFFGGEGFILQKLEGDGMVFLHAGGTLIERTLGRNEVLRVHSGSVVAMDPSVDFDIELQRGLKSMLFSGDGLFFAKLRGPGKVWIQSLPFDRLAETIVAKGGNHSPGGILGQLTD